MLAAGWRLGSWSMKAALAFLILATLAVSARAGDVRTLYKVGPGNVVVPYGTAQPTGAGPAAALLPRQLRRQLGRAADPQ